MRVRLLQLRIYILTGIVKFFAKLLFVELPPVLSVAALIKKNDKVLFIDLSYMKGLGLPGGVVKKGENLEKALKREVFEETGLEIKDLKYFDSVSTFFRGIPSLSVIFNAKASGDTRSSEEGEPVWVEPDVAKNKLAYSINKTVLEKYLTIV